MVPAANDGIDRGHAGKPLGGTGALVSGGSDDDISGLSQKHGGYRVPGARLR